MADNYREEFKRRYVEFLKASQLKGLDKDMAEQIAEEVADSVNCEEYIECTDSDYCRLCADEESAQKADGYGVTDVAKAVSQGTSERPKELNSCDILPIVMPVCKRCRTRHRLVQTLPTLICAVIVACALIITNIPVVKRALFDANLLVPATMRPFFVFAIATAVGILLGAALKRILMDSFSKTTVFNPMKIKTLSFLSEGKWQRLYQNRQYKIMFTSQKPEYMRSEQNGSTCTDTEDEHTQDFGINIEEDAPSDDTEHSDEQTQDFGISFGEDNSSDDE